MTKPQLDDALQSLFAQGRDPMFITDKRGKLSHVNPAFLDLYQYDEPAIMGKPMRILLQPSLHDVVFYKSVLRRLLQHGSWIGELNIVTRTGEIIPVWTQILRVTDGFSALQVDLRERDKTARKLDTLSRLQSVSTLAGGIAHEFNNILGGMQGHLYLLKRAINQAQKKDHDRLLRLDSLMQRAATLVQNLLSFSKQKPTTSRDVALLPMLEEMMVVAKQTIGQRIELELHAEGKGLMVAVDPVLFKHHLLELL
ncbi:MAG: PAS domain-containing protein, partial [Mariprofundaceae bacterium]|nr:PAS domain-containing protein [Mariprofundaceae bacterium]